MNSETTTRSYRMNSRAESTAETGRKVIAAVTELWREKSLEDITLQEVAGRAGVTVQTVIRRFGSKEGLVEAAIASGETGVRDDQFKRLAEHGRQVHRDWCARVFAPYLPAVDGETYPVRLDAFVAATDLYLWKLIRRDLGRTAGQTRQVISTLLHALADHNIVEN